MAKTLDEAGVKRLIQEIKGANKNLNTPIPISTENTTESMAQNVKNIADFVAKAKAAGIEDVDGMAVTCIIDAYLSGVGCILGSTDPDIQGIMITDDLVDNKVFLISNGRYFERTVIVGSSEEVNSDMLAKGARRPIIFTPDTTEIDEETYQKLLSDDVDVLFKTSTEDANLCTLTYKLDSGSAWKLYFTCFSIEDRFVAESYLYAYEVDITKTSPHTCSITENIDDTLGNFINNAGYLTKSVLTPALQEIDLTGTDEERKAKLDQFEADWKALTGADTLDGARFVGNVETPNGNSTMVFTWNDVLTCYTGVGFDDTNNDYKCIVQSNGTIHINPLFSHLEAITIRIDNTPESKAANVAAIEAYEDNLEALGLDVRKGYMIPITASGRNGFLSTRSGNYPYAGYVASDSSVSDFYNILILGNGEYYDSKIQPENSSELNTISKKLVPAINEVNTLAKNKQDTLTSGTNIKTINNQSLLGSGNIEISAPSITVDTSMSDTSTNPVQNKVIKAYIDGLVGNVAA